jgi:hypothetical protein
MIYDRRDYPQDLPGVAGRDGRRQVGQRPGLQCGGQDVRGCLPRSSTYAGVQVHPRTLCGTRRTARRDSSAVSCSSHVGARTGTWRSPRASRGRPTPSCVLRARRGKTASLEAARPAGVKTTDGAIAVAIEKSSEEKVDADLDHGTRILLDHGTRIARILSWITGRGFTRILLDQGTRIGRDPSLDTGRGLARILADPDADATDSFSGSRDADCTDPPRYTRRGLKRILQIPTRRGTDPSLDHKMQVAASATG